jgi:adenosylhomocysteine nucleosidase
MSMFGLAPAGGAPTVTAIVAALPEEMAALRSRATDIRRIAGTAFEIVSGRVAGRPVVLAVTGDGAQKAREGVAAVLGSASVDRLIAIGVAGGLSRDLDAGALVVSDRVSSEGEGSLHADASLIDLAERYAGARRALVVTAGRIIDTVTEKARLLRSVGAGPISAVVDLESAAFAGAAARSGIPWLVLRAVSDTAQEELPALLNRCRDDGGAVRRGKVALALLREPAALPFLLSLRQRVQRCAATLAQAVEVVMAESARAQLGSHRDVVSLHGGS